MWTRQCSQCAEYICDDCFVEISWLKCEGLNDDAVLCETCGWKVSSEGDEEDFIFNPISQRAFGQLRSDSYEADSKEEI